MLAAGWYFGSPWWTLREMAAAARGHDESSFSVYVDYPALRADVKHQVQAELALRMAEQHKPGALAELETLLALGLANRMLDAVVSPAAVRAIFAYAPDRGEPPEGRKPLVDIRKLALRRDGFDQFRLVPAEGRQDAELRFRRHGLAWRLEGIRIPFERLHDSDA